MTAQEETEVKVPVVLGKPTSRNVIIRHFTQHVRSTLFSEFQLILLTFCTGIQDAVTFPEYHCFASNQTGNTVFLILALVTPALDGDMFITKNIGAAFGLFLAGGWLTGQLSHLIGPRRRWWLLLCNLVQTALVFTAAAIQWTRPVVPSDQWALLVVGLLAFAAGSQVVQSRSLAMTEISTAMATAAWVDLMIDQRLLCLSGNRPRNRRVAFLIALVLGSLCGAFIHREVGPAVAILVSASGKLLVCLMYLFAGSERDPLNQSMV
ncbi:Protein of unknown function (DUF1275) [Geosmithia morbida]|uniref:DUF1275 domain protein n=1 Tax=Geosmithia morbida TaxID=1094350 RepID=A0A9P5D2J9_9HYPO|nr:Protein of unknown function (DUF1275) [Geosmithia morbida]KAF4123947.1 Protein of unknown function (DUF1275) [Geosmithia morbida]